VSERGKPPIRHDVRGSRFDGPAPLRVSGSADPAGTVRLAVDGEVDIASADVLQDAMTAVLHDRTVGRLVVDFAGVEFVDSTGIAALMAAYRLAAAGPTEFVVVNCRPQALRVLEITGVDKLLTRGRS
jgi:anti-sigma B factor antagonist